MKQNVKDAGPRMRNNCSGKRSPSWYYRHGFLQRGKLNTFAACVIVIALEGDAVVHHGSWKAPKRGPCSLTALRQKHQDVGGTQLRKTVCPVRCVLAMRAFGCIRKTGPRNPGLKAENITDI